MEQTTRPRVKVCCISSRAEAQLAVRAGASALGLVGRMPSGPGVIPDELIAAIASDVPPPIATFLLTSELTVDAIVAHHGRALTSAIQIVDRIREGDLPDLRRHLPGIKLVQVIHIADETSIEEALSVADDVDALLLDSGRPGLPVKELGGTGRTHDWEISRRIREVVHRPIFLAGGLRPDNVREAVMQVRPFGVDVCSGVRTDGALDPIKLEAFIRAATG